MRSHVALLALAALATLACPRPVEVSGPPNVVLVSVDTLRADFLNAYGFETHRVSPTIDRLAEDGILFEQHIAASPWTTPSHMSLFTSLAPTSHGVNESFNMLRSGLRRGTHKKLAEARTTLAEVLQRAGYATAAFTGGITLIPAIGFDQGFERFETSMYKLDDANVGEMFAWLDDHASAPFFLFFHTFEVHSPFLHPELLDDAHAGLAPRIRAMAPELMDPESHMTENRAFLRFLRDSGAYDVETMRDLYAGGVRSMDGWLGRLIARLEHLGVYDRTLIVFTSDHGEELAEHDPRNLYDKHGHTAYEEIIRLPLIVKLPGQQRAGTRVGALTRAVDVMPTVLDVLELSAGHDDMQGRSLTPLWTGGAIDDERTAFIESAVTPWEVKSIRTATHKLVVEVDAQQVRALGRSTLPDVLDDRMLFDLRADPGEKHDLLEAGAPGDVALADRLEAALRSWLAAQIAAAGPVEPQEVELDAETIRRLEALGYADPSAPSTPPAP